MLTITPPMRFLFLEKKGWPVSIMPIRHKAKQTNLSLTFFPTQQLFITGNAQSNE
jgi:hypothetical protein